MTTIPAAKSTEAANDSRFAFGRNWQDYLGVLTEARIDAAVDYLRDMLGADRIEGATFLDVGSGSGLSSLAASRLGATRIHSFDYDPDSVACTDALRSQYGGGRGHWTVERGSALDAAYLGSLGQWDIVYSWGVLHHTGAMWQALDLVARLVRRGGHLYIAIYNDQGAVSRGWTAVKRVYNRGALGRGIVTGVFVPYFAIRGIVADVLRLRNPVARYSTYQRTRGMSMLHDWKDWLGGYPFEVATPEAIFDFCRTRGFTLEKLRTCGGKLGCNEFVFRRVTGENAAT